MKKAVDKKRTRSLWRRIQHTTEGTKKREEGTPRKKNVLVRQTSQIGYSSYKRKEEKERRRNVAWEKKEKNPVQEEKKNSTVFDTSFAFLPAGSSARLDWKP